MMKTWDESIKDSNGWAYESDVAKSIMAAMSSIAYEFSKRNIDESVYNEIFSHLTKGVTKVLK